MPGRLRFTVTIEVADARAIAASVCGKSLACTSSPIDEMFGQERRETGAAQWMMVCDNNALNVHS